MSDRFGVVHVFYVILTTTLIVGLVTIKKFVIVNFLKIKD